MRKKVDQHVVWNRSHVGNDSGTRRLDRVCNAEHILPLCFPSNRLRYEKQTKIPDWFRLLLFEVLHRGKFFKNEEYRKKSTHYLSVSVGSKPNFYTFLARLMKNARLLSRILIFDDLTQIIAQQEGLSPPLHIIRKNRHLPFTSWQVNHIVRGCHS